MKVNRLEVRDNLTELSEVVEDNLTAAVRNSFLANTGVFEESQEQTLDRVQPPALLLRLGQRRARPGSGLDGAAEVRGLDGKVSALPSTLDCSFIHGRSASHEIERLPRGLGLCAAEEVEAARQLFYFMAGRAA